MKFEPGNKLAKGGKRKGAGRPPKDASLIQQTASEIAREFIEQHVAPVMDTYLGLAAGQVVERTTKSGKKTFRLAVDAPTTRHFVDKLLPDDRDKLPTANSTVIQFIFGTERREIDVGLPQEGQRGNLNGGSIRLIGDEGGG